MHHTQTHSAHEKSTHERAHSHQWCVHAKPHRGGTRRFARAHTHARRQDLRIVVQCVRAAPHTVVRIGEFDSLRIAARIAVLVLLCRFAPFGVLFCVWLW